MQRRAHADDRKVPGLLLALLDEASRLDASRVFASSGRRPRFARGFGFIDSPVFKTPLSLSELSDVGEQLDRSYGWTNETVMERNGTRYLVAYTCDGVSGTLYVQRAWESSR